MCVSSLKQLPLRRPVFPGLTRELPRTDLSAEAFTTRMISAKKQLSQVVPALELHHHRLWDGAHLCGRLHHTASGLLDIQVRRGRAQELARLLPRGGRGEGERDAGR